MWEGLEGVSRSVLCLPGAGSQNSARSPLAPLYVSLCNAEVLREKAHPGPHLHAH